MKTNNCNVWIEHTAQLIVVFTFLLILFGSVGCVSPLRLTAEDRRSDVEFLTQWARDYHPCVEVTSKARGLPDYEKLLPKYMDLAEQAESNEEFLQVVWGYYTLIGASGHGYLVPEDQLLKTVINRPGRYSGLSYHKWR